ncbi:hypothetical protein M9458_036818, partial [Cirrhinus mrigala]
RMFQLDSMERPHECIFLDEAGFNLTKRRRRGRNIIGQRAIVDVTICAAISSYGVIHCHVTLGPYNTAHLITFLYALQEALLRREERGDEQAEHPMYVVIWDNVNFHRGPRIHEWFENNPRFINVCLSPYSPFLNPIEEFFSAWRWKVYDRNPYAQENLIQSMDAACDDIGVEVIQGWIRHAKGFFPRCLARDRIACDVDEVLWPDHAQRHDAEAE